MHTNTVTCSPTMSLVDALLLPNRLSPSLGRGLCLAQGQLALAYLLDADAQPGLLLAFWEAREHLNDDALVDLSTVLPSRASGELYGLTTARAARTEGYPALLLQRGKSCGECGCVSCPQSGTARSRRREASAAAA